MPRRHLLLPALVLMCLVGSCAHFAGVTDEQRASLESGVVGREAWLKRDITDGMGKGLPAGTHVNITKLSFAPAVILQLQLQDGKTFDYNVNKTVKYDDYSVRQTINGDFAFSREEYDRAFGSNVFTLEREGGGPLEWMTAQANITLSVPDGGNIAARIKNLSVTPLIIDWKLSSIVDLDGQAHRVTPGTTRGKNVGEDTPQTVVPPGAEVSELLLPEDKVDLMHKSETRLFPADGEAGTLVGKKGSALLAFRVGNDQIFQSCPFVVTDVKLIVVDPANVGR
jgi:hypothetical protein